MVRMLSRRLPGRRVDVGTQIVAGDPARTLCFEDLLHGARFHLETASLVIPQGTAIRRQRPR